MSPEATIKLKEKFGATLDTREAAMVLFEDTQICCNDHSRIVFDFNEVEFMSRSFADQFHKGRAYLSQCGIVCEIKNIEPTLFEMLQIISKTQNKTYRKFVQYPILSFDNDEKLFDFLGAL